jgi:hypothetical protein
MHGRCILPKTQKTSSDMMGHLLIDAGMLHRIWVDGILGCVREVCRIGLQGHLTSYLKIPTCSDIKNMVYKIKVGTRDAL